MDRILKRSNNRLTDELIYVGEWYQKPSINGRIKLHRYLVEKNFDLYDQSYFEVIGDWHYLKAGIHVHHIDFNHNNNELSNLIPLTKSEHVRLHNLQRKIKIINSK